MSQVSVTSHGSNIDLEVADSGGEGRAVVLIHGWPLSHEAWAHQIPALTAAGYRVIAYDRRGFGESDKPADGYDYDTLSDDLAGLLDALELQDVTLVGFSMGGGEVARYVARYGEERLHSVVFASAVPPFLLHSDDNAQGPIEREAAEGMKQGIREDREGFFAEFTRNFFTAGDEVQVSDEQLRTAQRMCAQADETAAVECIEAFAATDFTDDLTHVSVPTLVLHGSADGIVPFEGSGARTAEAIDGAQTKLIDGGPHGVNVSHVSEFNEILLAFLQGEG